MAGIINWDDSIVCIKKIGLQRPGICKSSIHHIKMYLRTRREQVGNCLNYRYMTDKILIHIHVPKCAGTSINRFLAKKFPERCLTYSNPEVRSEFMKLTVQERDSRYSAVRGHLYYGVHSYFSRSCQYFSVLRDPIERVCSYFNYVHLVKEHHNHAFFKENIRSIEDLSSELVLSNDSLRVNMNNYACRAYSGLQCNSLSEWDRVSKSVDNLVNSEQLYLGKLDSVLNFLAEENVCTRDDVLPQENVTKKLVTEDRDFEFATASNLSDACYGRLSALNSFDIRLYERYANNATG